MEKELTRKELYDLVWSKPVNYIAKEYGFSDNDVRKICNNHNIPLPKSGYWSKLKFNKKVVKEKLPEQDDNPVINLEKTNPTLFEDDHPLSKFALRKKELQEIKELKFLVPDRLSKPHRYIVATKKYHKELKTVEKSGGYPHEVDRTNALSISVSNSLYARSLRFMDSLIKLLEKRGHKVEVNRQTQVIIKEQKYNLRLQEKNKRVKNEPKREWDTYDLEPTGLLCLKISSYIPLKEWSDAKIKTLEDKLLDILAWLEIKAERDIQQAIDSAIWNKKYEEKRQKEKDLQKLKDDELSKFEGLFSEATRWHKSQYLRNYIKEFEHYAINTNSLDADKEEWIKWAKEKADWYDPFIEKDVELLNDIDRDTLKPTKKGYY
jgi:hypothetical protein